MPVSLREKLESGGPAIGLWASIPSALTAEAAALAGPDYVVADQQHGALDPATLMAMLTRSRGRAPRRSCASPATRRSRSARRSTSAPHGVIVPMVETGEQAAQAVAACRYAPEGSARSARCAPGRGSGRCAW